MIVRLHRGPIARVFGGSPYQAYLSMLLGLYVGLFVVVAVTFSLTAAASLLIGVAVLGAAWGYVVNAWATVDEDGLRWRFATRQAYSWNEIESVEFGDAVVRGTRSAGQAAIKVVVRGRRHVIGPALGTSEKDRTEFARTIVEVAARHVVPTQVSRPRYWPELERS